MTEVESEIELGAAEDETTPTAAPHGPGIEKHATKWSKERSCWIDS